MIRRFPESADRVGERRANAGHRLGEIVDRLAEIVEPALGLCDFRIAEAGDRIGGIQHQHPARHVAQMGGLLTGEAVVTADDRRPALQDIVGDDRPEANVDIPFGVEFGPRLCVCDPLFVERIEKQPGGIGGDHVEERVAIALHMLGDRGRRVVAHLQEIVDDRRECRRNDRPHLASGGDHVRSNAVRQEPDFKRRRDRHFLVPVRLLLQI